MHRHVATLLATLCLAHLASAQAAVLVYLPLDDLVRNADAVVHGKVLSSQAFQTGEEGRIYTRHTLAVTEYLKGQGEKQITVVTMGGEMEEFGQVIPGEARLTAGEEVVLCLARSATDYVVFNMSQGQFALSLKEGQVTVTQQLKGVQFVGRKGAVAPVEMGLKDFRKMVNQVTR
jgi:hypothetical protein